MAVEAKIEYADGRYPFAADAAYEPGDVIIRPSGTLAIYDGLNGCDSGDRIQPDPVHPFPTAIVKAATADTWSAAAALYWDDTNKKASTTSSGNTFLGRSIAAKTSGQLTTHVELTTS